MFWKYFNNCQTLFIVMFEVIIISVLLLYILPTVISVVWSKLCGDKIASQSFIPIINLVYAVVCCCVVILIIVTLIIERFPNLIYNYRKISNDIRKKQQTFFANRLAIKPFLIISLLQSLCEFLHLAGIVYIKLFCILFVFIFYSFNLLLSSQHKNRTMPNQLSWQSNSFVQIQIMSRSVLLFILMPNQLSWQSNSFVMSRSGVRVPDSAQRCVE